MSDLGTLARVNGDDGPGHRRTHITAARGVDIALAGVGSDLPRLSLATDPPAPPITGSDPRLARPVKAEAQGAPALERSFRKERHRDRLAVDERRARRGARPAERGERELDLELAVDRAAMAHGRRGSGQPPAGELHEGIVTAVGAAVGEPLRDQRDERRTPRMGRRAGDRNALDQPSVDPAVAYALVIEQVTEEGDVAAHS